MAVQALPSHTFSINACRVLPFCAGADRLKLLSVSSGDEGELCRDKVDPIEPLDDPDGVANVASYAWETPAVYMQLEHSSYPCSNAEVMDLCLSDLGEVGDILPLLTAVSGNDRTDRFDRSDPLLHGSDALDSTLRNPLGLLLNKLESAASGERIGSGSLRNVKEDAGEGEGSCW